MTIAFVFLSFAFFAEAQAAPEFLSSWLAQSFVPSGYQGKIFPSNGTKIESRFELVENGKIIDLSKTPVRWYINDELMANEINGLGIKTFSFVNLSKYGGNDIEIRISIPDYKGQSLDKFFVVPVKFPEVVIVSDYFERKILKGVNYFYAQPFFFNSSKNLSFFWMMNGRSVGADSPNLSVDVDQNTKSGSKINLYSKAGNSLKELEFAETAAEFEVK